MLDLIPLARPRWKMTNRDGYSNFISQLLQKELPTPVSASVAPTSISANEQIFASCIVIFSNQVPPLSYALYSKFCSIMAFSDVNDSVVSFEIINPIRNRGANRFGWKIIHVNHFWLSFLPPSPARIFIVADELLFLCIYRNYRITCINELGGLTINIAKLSISLRTCFAF